MDIIFTSLCKRSFFLTIKRRLFLENNFIHLTINHYSPYKLLDVYIFASFYEYKYSFVPTIDFAMKHIPGQLNQNVTIGFCEAYLPIRKALITYFLNSKYKMCRNNTILA